MTHILTFDIEDWFHVLGVPDLEKTDDWEQLPTLVENYTYKILDILRNHNVKATFFIVGWIASKYPTLVLKIAEQGHEIASHSNLHRPVFEMNEDDFESDLLQSKSILESIIGMPVLGYRAPSFSILPGNEWAFEVLSRNGIIYDASLFPAKRPNGGYPCPRDIHMLKTDNNKPITEIPMSVIRIGRFNLPFSGGGYFRICPYWVIDLCFKILELRGKVVVVYLHPKDFCINPPHINGSIFQNWKYSAGLRTTEKKLSRLLGRYRFTSCKGVLKDTGFISGKT